MVSLKKGYHFYVITKKERICTVAKPSILCEKTADKLIIRIPGEIDHHSAKALREEIDRAIFYHRPQTLVLSLSEVSFMDSSGLGLILGRLARIQELGGELVIADPNLQVMKILRLAGLEKKIRIERSERKKTDET